MAIEVEHSDSNVRARANRVARACDRCRIRKIKCNGKSQCNRCRLDDALCVYTKKRRPNDRAYSKEYVQLLEEQQMVLIKGVKELYRRNSLGERLPDLPHGCNETMLIHEVLSSLNVLPKNVVSAEPDTASYGEAASSPSSVCELMDPQVENRQTCFSNFSMPDRRMSPITASESSQSPALPTATDFEGFMVNFEGQQLQLMNHQNLDPTTKSFEFDHRGLFPETFLGSADSTKMPQTYFVNPRDMIPLHLALPYTT